MKASKGFTLIELMIVASIISILVVVFAGALNRKDQSAYAAGEAKQFAANILGIPDANVSCMKYDTDNNGYVSCTIGSVTQTGQRIVQSVECATESIFQSNEGCRMPQMYQGAQ